eukprot:55717_1
MPQTTIKSNQIKITIKSLNGNKNELSVANNETVKNVKMALQEIEGIRFDQLRLIFKGKLLKDVETLQQKDIKDGALIHSAIMLRGGMMSLYGKGRGKRAKKKQQKKGNKKTKSPGALRVQVDLDELDLEDLPHVTLNIPEKEDLQNFIVNVKITSKDSFWFGATYSFKFVIPDNYPFKPPNVTCLQKIYHPNIDVNGPICLNLLKKDWKPILTVQQIIHGLIFLFLEPNHADPLNLSAAKVMREDKHVFASNVKKSLRGGYVDGTQFDKLV